MLNLCHGIFTDRSIFRLNFPQKKQRQFRFGRRHDVKLVSCDWSSGPSGSLIREKDVSENRHPIATMFPLRWLIRTMPYTQFFSSESNANEKNLLFSIICIRVGPCKVRRLKRTLATFLATHLVTFFSQFFRDFFSDFLPFM